MQIKSLIKKIIFLTKKASRKQCLGLVAHPYSSRIVPFIGELWFTLPSFSFTFSFPTSHVGRIFADCSREMTTAHHITRKAVQVAIDDFWQKRNRSALEHLQNHNQKPGPNGSA
ncbi:hypothetical protein BpHYR1_024440 [Brachionus plicatilis]|uniref:Uncharacterized protein n=1 Tax=Brachionus plicatilis TaxID=10195 RepID=A0A3M7SBD6_BRAPC|nr:hypothetical protein BpHYR1_024440 [Brachionus plicatilis]RNA32889.1 hypothetical protein BpHYR1_024440 [Brachionus plicatilis]